MGSRLSNARGSLKNESEGTSSGKNEVSYEELPSLMRIRDLMSLLLTYPMKIDEEGILKSWIRAFPEWKAQLLSTDHDTTVMGKPWRVLTEKALGCMTGFMPTEITSKIESGERSIFNHNDADAIPEAILHLTVDLAVNQLIQTLFSGDYYARYICLPTRNLAEKRSVVNKIEAALEEKHNMFGLDKDFLRALWIDASTYETDAEIRVQEEIDTMMAAGFSETKGGEEKNRHLVIVVDTDSNKKLDLHRVRFPTGIVVVLITTEPKDDDFRITSMMDLNIRTQDHLLPWELFCCYVGSSKVCSSLAIQRISVQIVKECHGHLLALVLLAKYLKNVEDVKLWQVALEKLSSSLNPSYDYRDSDGIGISRVMVNAFVDIIWEDIDDTQKLCLELSLSVHNIKIGERHAILVSDWANILLGHTQEMKLNSDEFDEYRRHIRELLDRFVLLRNERGDVYLPVETYDIIKSLHTLNPSIIRHDALGLPEPPCIGRWHDLIQIELMDNKICELPQSPDCPKLRVFLLHGNVDLMDIPDSFFDHMPLLQQLDLSYTSIRDLPSSVSKLTQLKKFYLRGCDLFMELPPQIGLLKNLEELDLDGTLITHLPKEIRELINLRSLTLCFDGYNHVLGHGNKGKQISNSTIIPTGLISNLTQLVHLNIKVDPEDERWNDNVNTVFLEIIGLKRLETVSIYVPKANLLQLIPVYKSLNFRLVVGNHMRRFISRVTPELEEKFKHCDYSIKFVNGVNVPNVVKMKLGNFKALYLDRHMTIKGLSDFELRNLSGLQVCILAECNQMETIVDRSYFHDGPALPNLEFLSVFYMKNLKSICERPNPSFLRLKSIALHTCPMLTTVFTVDSLKDLSMLEEIIIEDCPKVTTLIRHDSSEIKTWLTMPKLRKISLLYLPELVNIFNGLNVEHYVEKMVFYYCPKLQSLSQGELSTASVKIIKGESVWWEALKWNAAEWGNAGRPNFFERIFSPINEEADIMTQLAAHQETQLRTDHDEFLAKKENTGERQQAERSGQTECKYYLRSGGCKFGKACKFNHTRGMSSSASATELNFLGLPIRVGEKECIYYMCTGSCKFGANCRFNHPDPTAVGGGDSTSGYGNGSSISLQGVSQSSISSWSSTRPLNESAPFVPVILSPNPGVSPQSSEWNGYQAPVYLSERSLHPPTTYVMNNPAMESNVYMHHQKQMQVEEFPERPGEPECSYFLKIGDCKFKSNCKFHHPKNRIARLPPCNLSDKGLPLRPDQDICAYYRRYGTCKFGPACKFDHPAPSTMAGHDQQSSYTNSAGVDVAENGGADDGNQQSG